MSSKGVRKNMRHYYLAAMCIAATSEGLAVTVNNQVELDAAISSNLNPIDITGGNLSVTNAQIIAADTELSIGPTASLDLSSANQSIGSLSGAGALSVGTKTLTFGNNNLDTVFSGTIHITGASYQNPSGSVVKTGTGVLTINNATLSEGSTYINQGGMLQTSGNTAIDYLAVGEGLNGLGALNISGGTLSIAIALQVGDFGGQGTVNQTGGNVILPSTCGNPAHCSSLNIGNQGGSGIYNMSGGTLSLTQGLNAIGRSTGAHAGSTGILNLSGGTIQASTNAPIILGYSGVHSSTGIINQTGGILSIDNTSVLYLSSTNGSGVYNFNGGVLEIGGLSLQKNYPNPNPSPNPVYQFNLGGGRIKVIGIPLILNLDARLIASSMSTIDTNGIGATWNGTLSGDGGLNKNGAGTFTLNNQSTYTGATLVNAGIFSAGAVNVLAASSAFEIASGARLELNNFDQTLGSFAGSGDISLGSALLTAGGDGRSSIFSGSLHGTGGLTKLGSGSLTLAGDNSAFTGTTTLSNGALILKGNLGGNVNTAANTRLSGNATLGLVGQNALINGIIQPGSSSSVGTLSFNGDYTQNSGSVYELNIINPVQYNSIRVAGTATINNVTQVHLLNQNIFPVNTSISILHAEGGLFGQYSDLIAASSLFVDFKLSYGANDVFLSGLRNPLPFALFARTPNQMAVADAIDSFSYLNPQNPLYLAVANLDDPLLMPEVFNSLSGQIHAAAFSAYVEESRYLRNAVLNRLDSLTNSSLVSKNTHRQHRWNNSGLWMEGYGAWGAMDSPSTNTAPLKQSNKGFFIGLDTPIFEQLQTGVLAGIGETSLNMSVLSSSGNSDNAYLGFYSSVQLVKVSGYFGAAYAWHHLNTKRFVQFPGVADLLHAAYQVPFKQVFTELGYDLCSDKDYKVKPFLQAAYVDVSRSSFSESGGISALSGFSARNEMPYTTTGLRMNARIGQYKTFTWNTRALLGWQHAYHSLYPSSPFAFSGGSVFLITGVPIAQNAALIDASVDVSANQDKLHLLLGYVGQLSNKIQDNGLQGTISWTFS